ncbi:MAG: hypothetical protein PHC33_03360 [Candidatus Omnitrophica bacterium]|nr:hypothetical protein [Candidatus Omnitrophota bacterium]
MSAKVKFPKRAVYILFVVFLSVSVLVFKPLVISAAKAQLLRTFPESIVSVGGCALRPGSVVLADIKVENKKAYELAIKEAAARFSLFSLISGHIAEVQARGINIDIRAPREKTADLRRLVRGSSGKKLFGVGIIRLSDVDLRIAVKDLEVKAFFSLEFNLPERILSAFDLRVDSFRGYNFEVSAVEFSARQQAENGRLTIQKICYNSKLAVTDIESAVSLKKEILSFNGLSAHSLGGDIRGEGKLRLDNNLDYLANLSARGIALDRLTGELDLKNRIQMSGTLGGEIGLRGQGRTIRFLDADCAIAAPGGTLVITDAGFLDTISRSSGRYLEAVPEGFKDYRYAEGRAHVYKEGEDYVLEVFLDGEQGKRNFKVTVGFDQGG